LNDLCTENKLNVPDCSQVSNGIVKLGLLSVVAYYRRQARELYKYFLAHRFEETIIKNEILNSDSMQEFGIFSYF